MKKLFLPSLFFCLPFFGFSQLKIGNNPSTLNSNALLEMETTDKGILFPRIALTSTTSVAPLSANVQGMILYNTATAGDVTPGLYYNDGTKWVRIGAGAADLRITNGNSHITADAGIGSNGSNAGNSEVIAVGAGAGSLNNAAGVVLIGHNAGQLSTNGAGATFIGYQAGRNNGASPSNTYIGYQAGLNISSSNDNTAVGYQAGYSGGSYTFLNTYLGSKAGYSQTGGHTNTGIGGNALFSTTTGAGNTAIGSGSLQGISTGNDNTGLGKAAMPNNNTGSNNVVVGSSALYWSSNGGNNTALGSGAGYQVTTGANNVFLGYAAGNNNTSGSGNVVVGYLSQAAAATGSNQLSIGNLIYGTDLDGVANTISTGNIGIGLTTPTATLQLRAGTAAAGKAPLKFTSGTNLTSPEDGAVEFDGSNYYVTSGTTRYTLAKTIRATITYDFSAAVPQSSNDQPFSVPGAAVGDFVVVNPPAGSVPSNTCYTAYIATANTVNIRFNNFSSSSQDPPAGAFQIMVIKF